MGSGEGGMGEDSVVTGDTLENESDVTCLLRARGRKASKAEAGKGMDRISPSMVCRRPMTEMRRIPLLNFSYEDLRDELEVMEGVVEAIEQVVNDDVVVGGLSSLQLSEV